MSPQQRARPMPSDGQTVTKADLCQLAKQARTGAGKTQAEAAEDFSVSQPTVAQAENDPDRYLFDLRQRMLERYAGLTVEGPFWRLRKQEE